jgi:hypothetical protein
VNNSYQRIHPETTSMMKALKAASMLLLLRYDQTLIFSWLKSMANFLSDNLLFNKVSNQSCKNIFFFPMGPNKVKQLRNISAVFKTQFANMFTFSALAPVQKRLLVTDLVVITDKSELCTIHLRDS